MKKDQPVADALSIGIEIGGTKTQVGIGSAEGRLLPGGILRKQVDREKGADGILRDIVSMVDEILSTRRHTLADISKVGIAFGGILDSARGVTLKSYQLMDGQIFPSRNGRKDSGVDQSSWKMTPALPGWPSPSWAMDVDVRACSISRWRARGRRLDPQWQDR